MLLVNCQHCANSLQIPEQGVGKKIRCPHCHNVFEAVAPVNGSTNGAGAIVTPKQVAAPSLDSRRDSPLTRDRTDRRDWGREEQRQPARKQEFPWLLLLLIIGLPVMCLGGLGAGGMAVYFLWARDVAYHEEMINDQPDWHLDERDRLREERLRIHEERIKEMEFQDRMEREKLRDIEEMRQIERRFKDGIREEDLFRPEVPEEDLRRLLPNLPPELRKRVMQEIPLEPHPDIPLVRSIKATDRCVWSVSFSADGNTLLTSDGYFGPPGHVKVWKMATGDLQSTLLVAATDVLAAAYSPDNKRVAMAGGERGVEVIEVPGSKTLLSLRHPSYVRATAFSPDGKRLASSCESVVRTWDAVTGRELWSDNLAGDLRTWRIATRLSFSPDGKSLATGNGGNVMKVYDAEEGKLQATCEGHTGIVICTAYSPNGKLLASGSFDRTIKLWDSANHQEVRTLKGHRDWVFCVAFSPDNQLLASAGREGTVILWDPNQGNKVASFKAHPSEAVCVTFSPDGKLLASSGVDGTIKLWDLTKLQRP